MFQNHPNPFNPTTNIVYTIPESGLVQLMVYDILGNEVVELVNENQSAGKYSVEFNANNDLASGIYIYTITINEYSNSRKMIYLK